MRVLIACEESQTSCLIFRQFGIEAFSCDIKPCSGGHPEWHIQGDAVAEAYSGKYDLMLAHPPCTYLSRARGKKSELLPVGKEFFMKLYDAPIKYKIIENPVPFKDVLPPYDCLISPHMFGASYSKMTCLWLHNLPPILPTCFVAHPKSFVFDIARGKGGKSTIRSKSSPIMYFEIIRQTLNYLYYVEKIDLSIDPSLLALL